MKKSTLIVLTAACAVAVAPPARAQQHKLVYTEDGTFGDRDTPTQPWSGYRVHDPDRPKPKNVDPGTFSTQDRAGRPPSDAIILFDGKDVSKWKPNQWKGNNGVLLMGDFEIQIFDPTTKIYADGQAAAVYGHTRPSVTASRPPGQWEVYDIIFTSPKFDGDKLAEPARVTVLYNGVLVHYNQEIYGPTGHASLPRPYRAGRSRAPLALGAHNNPVRFRNIWIRPL